MLSVITTLEFFQHHFAKMGHRNTSCDPHLHQAVEQPMLPTSREASAAGRLRPNALTGEVKSNPQNQLGRCPVTDCTAIYTDFHAGALQCLPLSKSRRKSRL